MLINAKTIEGFKIHARDGEIGQVHDILFDDAAWVARYLVVNTGSWFNRERVLLSPECVLTLDLEGKGVGVVLTRQQVKDSPDVSFDLPVSRQEEERLRNYYAWPAYWGLTGPGGGIGMPVTPAVLPTEAAVLTGLPPGALAPVPVGGEPADGDAERENGTRAPGDPHLRSVRDIRGYRIGATDGDIGHVEDVTLDDEDWSIRRLVVDTVNWWPLGKDVWVPPSRIRSVSWPLREVLVSLTRQQIKDAPLAEGAA